MSDVLPIERIGDGILFLRDRKVILDHDLAQLYGVKTFRLNEQVKRNFRRFPADFMFRLTPEEKEEVIANCDHLKNLKYSPVLPYAFTEHGTVMAATILNTEVAINVSVQIVRAFVRLSQILSTHKDLARKLEDLENRYDSQFRVVFDAIRQLMAPAPIPKKARIGF
ncbi:MAG: ORF6N domain-containing protein [Deltaproteobacteria bacterium]|nr:ORF6N domain-containing protein [Deltaproteobacteria bacterium]